MAYIAPFLRLNVIGTAFGVETFSYGLALVRDFNPDPAPTTVPQSVIDAVTTFHTSSGIATPAHKLTTIKLNEIGENGRYTSAGDTVQHDFTTPVAGIAGTYHPPQCALAISLMTDKQRGRASRGRFYIPGAVPIDNQTGRVSQANQQFVLDAATAFLDDLNLALPGYKVGVTSNIGLGALNIVTGVRVGSVIDTMRSRRRNFNESYLEGALA